MSADRRTKSGMKGQVHMKKKVLFRVLMGIGGHEYVIYDNGDIEGFGEGAIVFSHYPFLLLASERAQGIAKGISSDPAHEIITPTSDFAGPEHSTPA